MNLEVVKDYYGKVLRTSKDLKTSACCDGGGVPAHLEPLLANVHEEVIAKYYGCGIVVPTALQGCRVLDLGSGSGRDVYMISQLVGPQGEVVGVDMTDEQLETARSHIDWHMRAFGYARSNVKFLKGYIETLGELGLEPKSFDVIVSNCVINLAPDKAPVFQEALRVLKPGGRFAVSDIVIHGGLPAGLMDTAQMRQDLSSWAGCIAGALTDAEYRAGLAAAGFTAIDLEITRRYIVADIPASATGWTAGLDEATRAELVERFASTFVRAMKPAPGS